MADANEVAFGGLNRGSKLAERVAREIVAEIVRNGLQVGDALPTEAEMVESFGVGRASVREGLRILEVQGLISIRAGPRGGPRVAQTSARGFGHLATLHFQFERATFRELIFARQVLEPVLAAEAAVRRDPDAVASIMKCVDVTESSKGDRSTLHALAGFHNAVVSASGNKVLGLYANALAEVMREHVAGSLVPFDAHENVQADHRETAIAIADGDSAAAHELMLKHMQRYSVYMAERHPGLLDEIVDWMA